MNKRTTVEIDLLGKNMTLETGLMAHQAAGAVAARLCDTIVFSAVTATETPREGVDFLPLQVEYRERSYAAGKFPGGYFKREGRPTEREILVARATDRPIRALFPDWYHNDVQINCALLCADGINDSDVVCINAASAALMISELPFMGPVGAVRVGRVHGQFILNPTHEEMEKGDLNLIYVGTRELPVMIEGSALEAKESDMVAAMRFAHEAVVKIVDAQIRLREAVGLPQKIIVAPPQDTSLEDRLRALIGNDLQQALLIPGKQERQMRTAELRQQARTKILEEMPDLNEGAFAHAFDKVEIETVRRNVLQLGKRIDGRGFDDIRPLYAEVGVLPRTHGSALFSRGETQALATVTLGTMADAQELDAWTGGPEEKRFILHYNFPPYSTGEVGRLGGINRREIGHGALAERSLYQMMVKDYPYTVRIVSEIMSSNGSSSMATVCAGSLALMDAGVPLARNVAGVSIGLFTGEKKAVLVTDIIGAEDHCGDMDFKVAGTRNGVTGFQVDLKIQGLAWDLVEGAFEKARVARHKILDFMESVIAAPRPDLSPYAPRITVLQINPDKIGALIGPGGKNIRRITDTLGVQIDIEDNGKVHIYSQNKEAMDAAVKEVELVAAEAEVGKIYRGTVTGIKEFGAFVEFLPGKEGLVHISELADFRVKKVEDVVKMGEQIWVKCINVDENGKVRLSRKAALKDKDAQPES